MGASTAPGEAASTAPPYTMHHLPSYNYRLRLSSTGSSRPAGGTRHLHREVSSGGPGQGQWGNSLRPSCKSPIKRQVLRYLKRVRVTPALHRRFTWLNPGLTDRQ